jgi:hypothetical protein
VPHGDGNDTSVVKTLGKKLAMSVNPKLLAYENEIIGVVKSHKEVTHRLHV